MSAQTKKNVFEALTVFAEQGGEMAMSHTGTMSGAAMSSAEVSDPLAMSEKTLSSLHALEVFHQEFKLTEDLPKPNILVKTYEDGLAEGQAAARQDIADVQAIAEDISANLSRLGTQIEESHSRCISRILRAVLPTLCEQRVGHEIEAFLKSMSAQAIFGQVTLDMHPDAQEKLEPLVTALTDNKHQFMFEISTNPDLGPNDVKASWHGGDASIETGAALAKIMSILDEISDPDTAAPNPTLIQK